MVVGSTGKPGGQNDFNRARHLLNLSMRLAVFHPFVYVTDAFILTLDALDPVVRLRNVCVLVGRAVQVGKVDPRDALEICRFFFLAPSHFQGVKELSTLRVHVKYVA